MKQNALLWAFIPLFILVLIYLLWYVLLGALNNKFWSSETLGKIEYRINELQNLEIIFPVTKLVTGKHDLEVYFSPYDFNLQYQEQSSIFIEFTIKIQQGEKFKERKFSKTFNHDSLLAVFYLFDVPYDLLWSKNPNLTIIIKDINFNSEALDYFEKINFRLIHLQLIGHNINIINGERIKRNKGFRSW